MSCLTAIVLYLELHKSQNPWSGATFDSTHAIRKGAPASL